MFDNDLHLFLHRDTGLNAIVFDNPVVADEAALCIGRQIFKRVFAVANRFNIDDIFIAKNIPPDSVRAGKLPDRRIEFSPEFYCLMITV